MATPFKLKDKKEFDFGNKGSFNFNKKNDYSQEGIEKRQAKKQGKIEGSESYSEYDARYEEKENV
tara:strand:+ start:365 stop:559 length:195 start_codon:yes stop_codon:yes gene_type:complete